VATNQPADTYDVAVLGGGLAGLTLGLQLKRARPDTTIFIAEKRPGPAPEAAFKVGESTVELSCNYFGDVIGMRDHLEQDQIHKCGLRFFFTAGDNTDLAERVELGPPLYPPVPSYQLDRGRFENEAVKRNLEAGVDVVQGAFIDEIELGDDEHAVTIVQGGPGGERTTVKAKWMVDASGRSFLLKRKLGLEKSNGHVVNSSWFRLAGGLDIEEWVSPDDAMWFERMKQRGWRRFSTNHLCGQGYWVWLIPLSSGPISIGIVADPRFHPWERMDTLEASLDWIREYEPQLGEALDGRADQVEDFLKIEDFSYSCDRVFSADRWCLTGEAGAFLDPFYSPGSDYIAMSNTFITDLVTRELDGEDVKDRVDAHNDLYLSAFATHLTFYENQYVFWGNPQVMGAKITANNILYWGANALLFFKRKLTDLEFMAAVRPDVERIWALVRRLEGLFREWHELDSREWRRGYVGVTDFPALIQRHVELAIPMDDDALKAKIAANADLLEAVAVLIFNKAAKSLGDAAPDEDVRIDPYKVSLDPDRWEADGLFSGSGLSAEEARQTPAGGLESCFTDVVAQPAMSER
jgi:flavin-dependent dehydrogenase